MGLAPTDSRAVAFLAPVVPIGALRLSIRGSLVGRAVMAPKSAGLYPLARFMATPDPTIVSMTVGEMIVSFANRLTGKRGRFQSHRLFPPEFHGKARRSAEVHGRPIAYRPPYDPRRLEPDERTDLEPLCSVLLISGSQCVDRQAMLGVTGLDEARRRLNAEPGEPRPILIPPIGEHAHPWSGDEIPDARELMRIGLALGFLVERRVEDRAVPAIDDGEADRDLSRPAARGDRRENHPATGVEEYEVLRTQDQHGRSIVRSPPTRNASIRVRAR